MFLVYRREIADVEPTAYIKGAASLGLGVACKLTSGQLAKCGATDMPAYIINGPQRADGTYPVIRVLPTTIFETLSTAAITADKVGTSVQLDASTAEFVTATAAGPFIVTYTENGVNAAVRGYFKELAAGG